MRSDSAVHSGRTFGQKWILMGKKEPKALENLKILIRI
jgi:hypothetical protein